jgi:uncharacterized protein
VASERVSLLFSALLLSIGVALAGFFIGDGISNRSGARRIISVKGLSEREVPASVATWTIGYNATGNDLDQINKKLGESTKAVIAFLKERGFDEKEVAVQPPSIIDTSMEQREKDVPPPPQRFSANQSVLLRTTKVDAIKPALASAANLMISGVFLSGKSQPNYIFNQLNEIKPGMIQRGDQECAHCRGPVCARLANQPAQVAECVARLVSSRGPGPQPHPNGRGVRVVVDVEYEVN